MANSASSTSMMMMMMKKKKHQRTNVVVGLAIVVVVVVWVACPSRMDKDHGRGLVENDNEASFSSVVVATKAAETAAVGTQVPDGGTPLQGAAAAAGGAAEAPAPPRQEDASSSLRQLCDALRSEQDEDGLRHQHNKDTFVVQETSFLCSDVSTPQASLLEMMASTVVADVGTRMEYQHSCVAPSQDDNHTPATLQQFLPFRMPTPDDDKTAKKAWKRRVAAQCQACATDNVNDKGQQQSSMADCFFFSTFSNDNSNDNDNTPLLESVLPRMQSLFQQASDNWHVWNAQRQVQRQRERRRQEQRREQQQQQAQQSPNASPPFVPLYGEEYDGVILYLSCFTERCEGGNGVQLLPLSVLIASIPSSVLHISIVLLESTPARPVLMEYAQVVQTALREYYPRVSTLSIQPLSSTAELYGRLLSAKHVILLPSASALLPTLLRPADTYTTVVNAEAQWHEWMSFWVAQATSHVHFWSVSSQVPVWTLAPDMAPSSSRLANDAEFATFFRQAPPRWTGAADSSLPSNQKNVLACHELRGRAGRWIQDVTWAQTPQVQYVSPVAMFRQFNFSWTLGQYPIPAATTFRWVDQSFGERCGMRFLDHVSGLCSVAQTLGFTRLYIIGDSLSLQFAQSLWKLLGHEDDPEPQRRDDRQHWQVWKKYQWSRTIACPGTEDELVLQFTRNDLLNGQMEPLYFDNPHEGMNCNDGYCLPWIPSYRDYYRKDKTSSKQTRPKRTLLVVNTGTHIHTSVEFRQTWKEFESLLHQHLQPQDWVVVRTTPPGHVGCQAPDIQPYATPFDVPFPPVDLNSWHKFAGYNDYLHRTLATQTQIQLLDVYSMTVLRPDGHRGGPDRCERCLSTDCLHYNLPGPGDWWVHLLYSHLFDLAEERQQQQQQQQNND